MKIENIKISLLEPNKGQIEGLPKNPRFIRDERYKALIKSIEDAPEMLSLRELIVYPHNRKYIAICGNMRLRACSEIGYKELPCKVLPTETPVEKLREYAIKDNNGFGQDDWSILNTEWDLEELSDWGVETWGKTGNEDTTQTNYNPDSQATDYKFQGLPEELQGVDINPDDLIKIEGDNETAMERVIIVYPKDREKELASRLGLESIDKVVYNIDEVVKI